MLLFEMWWERLVLLVGYYVPVIRLVCDVLTVDEEDADLFMDQPSYKFVAYMNL